MLPRRHAPCRPVFIDEPVLEQMCETVLIMIESNPSVRFGLTVFPSDADPADGFFGSLSGCVTGYDWPNLGLTPNPGSQFRDFLTKMA